MNPHDGAIRLCQLIRNEGVARELELRSELIKCDISFGWVVDHIERGLGFPRAFDVDAIEGADAVAVLLASEHVCYEVRRVFSAGAGTDPLAALRRLQRAAAQAPQSTRTINKNADALMAEIVARNPQSRALEFTEPSSPPSHQPLGGHLNSGSAPKSPKGTNVMGASTGLVEPPPIAQDVPDVGAPSAPEPQMTNSKGQAVDRAAIMAALQSGDADAMRALLE